MNLEFKEIDIECLTTLTPYFALRPNKTCDSVILDTYLWRDYYQTRYVIVDDKAVLWLMKEDGIVHTAMPLCKEEDLAYYFEMIREYFHEVLHLPFRIFLADEEAVESLKLREKPEFVVTEEEDLKDYLYDGDALRTLVGRKYSKKKNHLNAFYRDYEGRFEYRRLCCSDRDDVWKFLDVWRTDKGLHVEGHLDYEVEGIHNILKNCSLLNITMSGVYIDGKLEAFTIGSYNEYEKMAVIHIEKANMEIRGLYQFINQQFLVSEFPDAVIVNREDDVGEENLRKAKLSYHPISYARKYKVEEA